jgi:spore germination cell wall hydrolase CwlJ-like protein
LSLLRSVPAASAALLSLGLMAGCSQTDSGLGMKSAVANMMPGSMRALPGSTRGKTYRASARERECLARAMFFESNRSSQDGLVAVGSVVMNRRDTGKWGSDICSVVGAKRQFAPGVLSRPMKSKALPDVMAAADAVLKGKRHPRVHQNVMFFHTAGLKFPYKNMHYTVVAGGNSFYEKKSRRRGPETEQPVMQETMVASVEEAVPGVATAMLPTAGDLDGSTAATARSTRHQPAVLMASSRDDQQPVRAAKERSYGERQPIFLAVAPKPRPVERQPVVAMAEPTPERFGGSATPGTLDAQAAAIDSGYDHAQPTMSYEASPEQAGEVGALILQQQDLGQ